jgi:predicted nucleotide-binding protein (sugar kinase/HSP70/actin superfamily)
MASCHMLGPKNYLQHYHLNCPAFNLSVELLPNRITNVLPKSIYIVYSFTSDEPYLEHTLYVGPDR